MTRLLIILIAVAAASVGGFYLWSREAPEDTFRRGLAAVKAEDWETVEDCRDRLSIDGEWSSHRHLLSGHLLKADQKYRRAFLVFSKANDHPDTKVAAYYQAAEILYAQQRFSECIGILNQVLQWEPDHVDAHQLLAASSYDIGAMEQTIVSLDHVIRLRDKPARAAYMKGSVLFDFERFADSVKAFQLALKHSEPNSKLDTMIRTGCADAFLRLRQFEKVLTVLEPCPEAVDVLVQRSAANFSLNQLTTAASQATRALEQVNDHPQAAAVLAQVLERQDQRDRGIEVLKSALQRHPLDLPLHHRMADLLAADAQTDEALKYREEAARIAKLRSDYSHAQQDLIRDGNDPLLRIKVAKLGVQLERFQEADAWYRAAVGMAPADPAVNAAYAEFLDQHPQFQVKRKQSDTAGSLSAPAFSF